MTSHHSLPGVSIDLLDSGRENNKSESDHSVVEMDDYEERYAEEEGSEYKPSESSPTTHSGDDDEPRHVTAHRQLPPPLPSSTQSTVNNKSQVKPKSNPSKRNYNNDKAPAKHNTPNKSRTPAASATDTVKVKRENVLLGEDKSLHAESQNEQLDAQIVQIVTSLCASHNAQSQRTETVSVFSLRPRESTSFSSQPPQSTQLAFTMTARTRAALYGKKPQWVRDYAANHRVSERTAVNAWQRYVSRFTRRLALVALCALCCENENENNDNAQCWVDAVKAKARAALDDDGDSALGVSLDALTQWQTRVRETTQRRVAQVVVCAEFSSTPRVDARQEPTLFISLPATPAATEREGESEIVRLDENENENDRERETERARPAERERSLAAPHADREPPAVSEREKRSDALSVRVAPSRAPREESVAPQRTRETERETRREKEREMAVNKSGISQPERSAAREKRPRETASERETEREHERETERRVAVEKARTRESERAREKEREKERESESESARKRERPAPVEPRSASHSDARRRVSPSLSPRDAPRLATTHTHHNAASQARCRETAVVAVVHSFSALNAEMNTLLSLRSAQCNAQQRERLREKAKFFDVALNFFCHVDQLVKE